MAGGEERDEAVPVAPTEEEVVAIGHALVLEAQAAAKAGDVKALEALLEKHGPELINARDKDTAMTALHCAVRVGSEPTIKLLLDRGASPLLPDHNGYTALDYARAFKQGAALSQLREHVMADPPLIKQAAPLLSACFEAPHDPALMEWALGHYGAPLLDLKGRDLNSALHFAITTRDPLLVRRLIDLGAEPFVRDVKGRSPLDLAEAAGLRDVAAEIRDVMRVQLLAFVGLALMFLVFRSGQDPQLAWFLCGVLYPSAQTAKALQSRKPQAWGEWLTYWSLLGPVLALEKAAGYIPRAHIDAVFEPGQAGAPNAPLRDLLDLYMMAKIIATLYLVYPVSRGARKIFRRCFDPAFAPKSNPAGAEAGSHAKSD